MKSVLSMLPTLACLPVCFGLGCSSGGPADTSTDAAPDSVQAPIEVHAGESSFPAISACTALGYGTSLGIYSVEDLQPADGTGDRPAVLVSLSLQDALALNPPSHVWGLIGAPPGWDGSEPVQADIALRAGEDILLAVHVLEEDPNAPRVLLNNTSVFPRTDRGWTHAGWGRCQFTTEELREVAPRLYDAMETFDPATLTCKDDLFIPVPGGRRDCGVSPEPPIGDDPDAE